MTEEKEEGGGRPTLWVWLKQQKRPQTGPRWLLYLAEFSFFTAFFTFLRFAATFFTEAATAFPGSHIS